MNAACCSDKKSAMAPLQAFLQAGVNPQVLELRIEIWSSAIAVYVGNYGSIFLVMHVLILLWLSLFHSPNSDIFFVLNVSQVSSVP